MKTLFNITTVSLFIVLVTFGCTYAIHVDETYKGKIIDAETKEPIEGVVVLGVWYTSQFSPAGATHNFYDARETITDKNGEFSIPGMGLRILSNLEPMNVLIFKSGYEHIGLGPWESLKKAKFLKEKIKWEGDKAIIPLKKWTLKERLNRFGSYYVNIPEEKQKSLLREIEKERKEIGN
jgi:hypothetical protein